MAYTPSAEILTRYASLLVNFALAEGQGIAPGDTVIVQASESAKPLYAEVCRAIWRSGGHVISRYTPDDDATTNLGKDFLDLANDAQLDHYAKHYYEGLVAEADHFVAIRAEADPNALRDADAGKVMRRSRALMGYIEARMAKEAAGKFSWVLGSYGTPGMAAEANMTVEEYWEQIIAACQLNHPDPAARWREINAQIAATRKKLTEMKIDRVHVKGEDVDLTVKIGERRQWLGASGRNVPSYEVFTSPDWRGTEGWIRFSEPLYRYGSLIEGIELKFSGGLVTHSSATKNEHLLKEMIASDGADKVGEFSLTDGRLSPITKFMADTLFDENAGGEFGNTHIALGRAYETAFDGDPSKPSKEEFAALGFNSSAVHTDIVSRTNREVTATLADGSQTVIYKDGKFTV